MSVGPTILERMNKINDLFKRGEAYLQDARDNYAAARAEMMDMAAVFGIVMPEDPRPAVPPFGFQEEPYKVKIPPANGSGPHPLIPADRI
jgi:hypothetical protein